MNDQIHDLMNTKVTSGKKRSNWKKIVTTLSAIVVFCTTYMLILPAITMENATICGKEEHIHTEKCYETINTEQELHLECTYESLGVHVHSEECMNENGNLNCGYADYIIHEHTDVCYDAEQNLVCELPEIKEHKHTDNCYQMKEDEDGTTSSELVLVCDQADKVIHEHTLSCYDTSSGQNVLTCGTMKVLEHTHSDACMKSVEIQNEDVKILICEKEEHRHDETCLPEENKTDNDQENTDETANGEIVRPEFINAWAQTTEQRKELPLMRTFLLRNSGDDSADIPTSSEPLDMAEWINKVTMYKHENGKATEIPNGSVVYEGDLIEFKLEYTIEGQQLGKMENGVPIETLHDTVIYQIPKTFKTINSDAGDIYNSDDEIVGTYVIDSTTNQIILKFDSTYVKDNATGKQINGYISFYSIVDEVKQDTNTQQNHQFNSKVEVDFNVKESDEVKGDLSVQKTKISVEGNVIKYMITVTSKEGTEGTVTLTDIMSEDLTYIDGTLSVTKNGSPVNYSVSEKNNSLILTLPEMEAEDRYIISYSAEADINLKNAKMEVSNTATVESKDSHDNPLKNSVTVTHNFNILEKKGEPGKNGKIDWTITINKAKLDVSGWKLTDVLNGVEFKGPVNIYNSENVLIKENVTLPYTFPSGSTDTYYIKYTTEHSLMEGMNVTNEARLEKDGITVMGQDGSSIGTPLEKKGKIVTDEVQVDENGTNWIPIEWTVTVDTTAGPIPAGNSLVDKLLSTVTGAQEGYMTYDQVINAYYSINDALKEALNTNQDVLSLSKSKVTVFKTGQSYTITELLNNYNSSQSEKFEKFEFILSKDIPKGKIVTFVYTSTGIFYNNTVNNSTFVNRFSINDSYEVTAKVNFSASKLTASKRGIMAFDPNMPYGTQDWRSNYAEVLNQRYEDLKDNYLAWIIEVDTPPDYTGKGDVTLYEDMPEGITLKRLDISEKSGERWILEDVKVGKTYTLGDSQYGKYTVKVTEEGDLEIIIPEELIAYHSEWANNITDALKEFHTLFIVYTQMTDLKWPHVDENSTTTKKTFENNFTLVNSDGDTITFGKNIQNIIRDDSKGHVIKSASSKDNFATYEVILNPEGRDFDPNSSTLDVSDVLQYLSTEEHPLKLELVTKSVKLYEYDGKDSTGQVIKGDSVDFSYIYKEDFVTNNVGETTRIHTIDLVVPDGKPLVLEYKYRADESSSKEKHSLANSCTIESVGQGNISDDSQYEMEVQHSTAGADTNGLTLYKVDISDYGIYLPDAKFELFIWNKKANAYINVTDSEGNSTFVTDPNGKIVLDIKTAEGGIIAKNTAYKLVEIASPEHYYLLDKPYYFYVPDVDTTKYPPCMPNNFEGKALEEKNDIYMPNESVYTKLSIRKKWKDFNENDITVNGNKVSEVHFELWRKTVGVEDSDVNVGTYTITPDENGFWETVITNLPKGERSADGTKLSTYVYYIKEVSVPGFAVYGYEYDDGDASTNTDANGIQTGTIVITNKELEGYILPETGGIGTTPYTIGGLLLMLAATTNFLLYKNKKHAKEDE